ncbi:hypothetical protein EON65_16785 [archaeon]|nr:MAG: hypothetical protein EON65_16785 [archaeon]
MSRFLQGTPSDSFAWLNVDQEEDSIMSPARKLRRLARKLLYYGSIVMLGYGVVRLVARDESGGWKSWIKLPPLASLPYMDWRKAIGL